ncbi:response regulator transcription factor [Kitasatospora sp. NPDC052896]|uniref:response regulator transcription factor n=1 Tax=Kitasatospora sp. NPDC052896 TaxID=3364061 RepID=UPI0037C50993
MTEQLRRLTAHQHTILQRVADGHTYAEIARELTMTEKGLQAGVRRVLVKLGARNAPHAVHIAHQAGLLGHRPERHGDHAGYARHVRAGEDPRECPLGCHAAELAYRASRRAARTASKTSSKLPRR